MPPSFTAWIVSHAGVSALAFARAAGLAWVAPGLATPGLDARFRLLLAGLLGAILVPAIQENASAAASPSLGWQAVGAACVGELVVGAALGWSAALIVAGARQAGELVGSQAGLAPAALFNPEAGDEMTALGHLYGLVALGVFLALDGPLALVRALVESYRVIPPGGGVSSLTLTEGTAALAFGRVGEALALSLRAAAPVALALALAGVALGLLGRAAPSLQLLALAMPVRLALGLVLVLLGLAGLAATLAAAWGAWPGLT
jgi:flagellar biosynthesis protein FliR